MGSCFSCFDSAEEVDKIPFDRGYHESYMEQVDTVLDKKKKRCGKVRFIEGDVVDDEFI